MSENEKNESGYDIYRMFLFPQDESAAQEGAELQSAKITYKLFDSYMKASFTRTESLEIIKTLLATTLAKQLGGNSD